MTSCSCIYFGHCFEKAGSSQLQYEHLKVLLSVHCCCVCKSLHRTDRCSTFAFAEVMPKFLTRCAMKRSCIPASLHCTSCQNVLQLCSIN